MPEDDIATIHAQPTEEITVRTKGASQLQFTPTSSGLSWQTQLAGIGFYDACAYSCGGCGCVGAVSRISRNR